jgi:hypothetical protein
MWANCENTGFEIVLNYVIVKNSDLIRLALVVTLLPTQTKSPSCMEVLSGSVPRHASRYSKLHVFVGEPIGVFYGREFAGADPANGDALCIP